MVWLELAVCVAVIFFFGRRVAQYGDIIAVKTRLGGLWIGLLLISITTSLPELFAGISAVTFVNAPDLTIGNLLGANTFNLLNLAFLDIVYRQQSIMNLASPGQRITGWFSIVLVALVAFALVIEPVLNFSLGWVGWTSPVILVLYLFFVRQIFLYEQRRPPPEIVEIKYGETSLKRTFIYFAIAAVFIIGAGIWLATIGDRIAALTGLGDSFVGSILIALATTLPEITVSYSALRMGSTDLAISNMIGSNMFNMFLIVIDDLFYRRGPVLGMVSNNHVLTAATVIILTLVTLAALSFKPRRRWRLSWYNLTVIVIFFVSAYAGYRLSTG